MASPGFHDAQALIAKVKILINAQLKSVLKKVGLPVSGVKAAMQERIIARKLPPRPGIGVASLGSNGAGEGKMLMGAVRAFFN